MLRADKLICKENIHLGFWSGNLFLIAPFPDLCLLVPLRMSGENIIHAVRMYETLIPHMPRYSDPGMFYNFIFRN